MSVSPTVAMLQVMVPSGQVDPCAAPKVGTASRSAVEIRSCRICLSFVIRGGLAAWIHKAPR